MNFNSANMSLGQLSTHIQHIAFPDSPHRLETKYFPVISLLFHNLQFTFKKTRIFLGQKKKAIINSDRQLKLGSRSFLFKLRFVVLQFRH
jgi:hypothetical protein